jgi:hypothetical protein
MGVAVQVALAPCGTGLALHTTRPPVRVPAENKTSENFSIFCL